jgi:hypothetical protein
MESTGRDQDTTDAVRVANADGRRAHVPVPSAFDCLGQGQWTSSWVRSHRTE